MKIRSIILTIAATLACVPLARASITNVAAQADGDGAIICPIYSWPNTDTVEVYGDQHWGPGHILFDVTSDSELDPTLTLGNVIDNDTVFAWAGYHVNIYMNKPFTIVASPILNAPAAWSLLSFTPSGVSTGTNWLGQIDFAGSPPILPGGQIDFTYKLTFAGSTAFTEELIPIAVPEPSTLSLWLCGSLLLARRAAARKQ